MSAVTFSRGTCGDTSRRITAPHGEGDIAQVNEGQCGVKVGAKQTKTGKPDCRGAGILQKALW